MSGGAAPFAYAAHEGSREHVYALRRARWREAVDDWLADGRPDFLVVEDTPAPWGDQHGFIQVEGEGR
jgi:hypothetical protein